MRVEAVRIGLTEIVGMRREVRLSPVALVASQEVRLQRIAPRSVVRDRALFVPSPPSPPTVGLTEFLRTMWPPDPE